MEVVAEIQGFVLSKDNFEKPAGECNTLELICFEGQNLHIVNGHVVMVLKNSRYLKDGVSTSLVEGKIQWQSAAVEISYKKYCDSCFIAVARSVRRFV